MAHFILLQLCSSQRLNRHSDGWVHLPWGHGRKERRTELVKKASGFIFWRLEKLVLERKKKRKKKSDSGSREGKREGGKLSRGCVSKKDPPWLLVLFVCLCFLHWWNMGCGNIHHRPRRALFRLLLAETIRTILGNALFRQGMRDAVNTLKRKMQVYLRRSSRCFVLTTKLTFVNGMTSFLELQWLSFDLVYHASFLHGYIVHHALLLAGPVYVIYIV